MTAPASCPDADTLDCLADKYIEGSRMQADLRRIAARLRECHLVERAAVAKVHRYHASLKNGTSAGLTGQVTIEAVCNLLGARSTGTGGGLAASNNTPESAFRRVAGGVLMWENQAMDQVLYGFNDGNDKLLPGYCEASSYLEALRETADGHGDLIMLSGEHTIAIDDKPVTDRCITVTSTDPDQPARIINTGGKPVPFLHGTTGTIRFDEDGGQ